MKTTMKKRIGSAFLPNDVFTSEANKTIGKPIVGKNYIEVISNRRCVTGDVTESGHKILKKITTYFKRRYNLDVSFKWDIHCGCSVCPCSPGFNIYAEINSEIKPYFSTGCNSKDSYFEVFFEADKMMINMPRYKLWLLELKNNQ